MPRNKPTHIIIHCSDSTWGDARTIDEWHRERGFARIGYHYLILNGCRTYRQVKEGQPEPADDGLIEEGREEDCVGAHCLGYNERSIGICLIGAGHYSHRQLEVARDLVDRLRRRYGLPKERVLGHCETAQAHGKTCPCLDMAAFRSGLSDRRPGVAAGIL